MEREREREKRVRSHRKERQTGTQKALEGMRNPQCAINFLNVCHFITLVWLIPCFCAASLQLVSAKPFNCVESREQYAGVGLLVLTEPRAQFANP